MVRGLYQSVTCVSCRSKWLFQDDNLARRKSFMAKGLVQIMRYGNEYNINCSKEVGILNQVVQQVKLNNSIVILRQLVLRNKLLNDVSSFD